MAHQFHNQSSIKLPKSHRADEEFSAKKGVVLCKDCGAAYYKKSWKHGIENIKTSSEKSDPAVSFKICPACQMIKNKQYEGRITVKNLPERYADELEGLAEGFCRRAYERDPMHRLIKMEKSASGLVITTTENELANKLAHKIKSSFKNVKSRTKFAGDPSDVAEITIEFS